MSSTEMSAEQVSELIANLPTLEQKSTGARSFDRLGLENHAIADIQCLPFQVLQSNPSDQPARDSFAHLVNLPNLRSSRSTAIRWPKCASKMPCANETTILASVTDWNSDSRFRAIALFCGRW